MEEKIKTYTLTEAKAKLEHFCAYQERCHKEVVEKLQQMRMIPQAIEVIVGHLLEGNFLNEERFARTFARGKFQLKKWGRVKITQALKFRQISPYIIQEALQEIEEEYFEVFEAIAEEKRRQINEKNPYKARKKFIDYMLYRGWEYDLVYEKAEEFFPYRW